LLRSNFSLNSLNDLRAYIRDQIKLFEEFVSQYMHEVKDSFGHSVKNRKAFAIPSKAKNHTQRTTAYHDEKLIDT
jgi:uncharacterized protein YeaO (DUF488 family)